MESTAKHSTVLRRSANFTRARKLSINDIISLAIDLAQTISVRGTKDQCCPERAKHGALELEHEHESPARRCGAAADNRHGCHTTWRVR